MKPTPKPPFFSTAWGAWLMWFAVVGALIAAAAMMRAEPPRFALILATGSMRGTFDYNCVLPIEPVPYAGLRPGMIVVYHHRRTGLTVTHRLVARQWGWWVVKGDSNRAWDSGFMTPADYVGVVRAPQPVVRGPRIAAN